MSYSYYAYNFFPLELVVLVKAINSFKEYGIIQSYSAFNSTN